MNELNDVPSTESIAIDKPDINQPLAVRHATRKRQIPWRFGKDSDLLPSAQLAAMSTYSQVVSPEPSPVMSPQPSPSPSRSTSPIFVNHMDPEPVDCETVLNQFGLYQCFTKWPSVDPEDDVTINHLTDAPTFAGSMEYGHRKADSTKGPLDSSSNPFAPYLNATVYRLMSWFYQTGVKSLSDMDSLVHDMLRAPDFDAMDLEDFSASHEVKHLDDDPIHPSSEGWQVLSKFDFQRPMHDLNKRTMPLKLRFQESCIGICFSQLFRLSKTDQWRHLT
jgi:hypothetical protein